MKLKTMMERGSASEPCPPLTGSARLTCLLGCARGDVAPGKEAVYLFALA